MNYICYYECETCGKCFDDEDECSVHELQHTLDQYHNHLFLFNEACQPISLENWDDVLYITWSNSKALRALISCIQELGYSSENLENFSNQERGGVYWDNKNDTMPWQDMATAIQFGKKFEKMLKEGRE